MNDELWAGVHLKIQYATFHLVEMQLSIRPREITHNEAVQISAGAILANNWQQRFFPHFDAFLMAARAVPEIINACFGADRSPQMKDWFEGLDQGEKDGRLRFGAAFKPVRETFRLQPLSLLDAFRGRKQRQLRRVQRHGTFHRRLDGRQAALRGRFRHQLCGRLWMEEHVAGKLFDVSPAVVVLSVFHVAVEKPGDYLSRSGSNSIYSA